MEKTNKTYKKEIVMVLINRKDQDGFNNVMLCDTDTNSDTGRARMIATEIPEGTNMREKMTYMVAKLIQNIRGKIKEGDTDTKYTIIVGSILKGLEIESTRDFWLNNKKTKTGTDLSDNFLKNVGYIRTSLNKCEGQIKLTSDWKEKPHMYNGKMYGSETYTELVSLAWNEMDKIIPPRLNRVKGFTLEEN